MQLSGRALYLLAGTEYLSVFKLHTVIFYISSSKDFHTLFEFVLKNTPCLKMFHTMTCSRNDKVYALYRMKIHGVLKK